MRNKLLLWVFAAVIFSATLAWADKPEWAGEGGKPSEQQVEDHRNEMRAKNNDKAASAGEQGEKGKNKDKSKNKNKNKNKTDNDDQDGRKNKTSGKGRDDDD